MRGSPRKISYRRPIKREHLEEINLNIEQAIQSASSGNQVYEIWIRPKQRTNVQNDYFHKMVRDIAIKTGESVENIKHYIVFECFGLETFMINDKEYERVPSTSGLHVEQMTYLISCTEPIHAEFG
jgi:folate-dependent tRNA-U54 methylase TrmFO/GidA